MERGGLIVLFLGLTAVEVFVHMMFSLGAYVYMFGNSNRSKGKRRLWWLLFIFLYALEIYQEYCAAVSLASAMMHGILEGCLVWYYSMGEGKTAILWCLFINYLDILLNMPSLILDAILRSENLSTVVYALNLSEELISLGIFFTVFLICFWNRNNLLNALKICLQRSAWLFLILAFIEFILSYYLLYFIYYQAEWIDLLLNVFIILCIAFGADILCLHIQYSSLKKEQDFYLSREQLLRKNYEKLQVEQKKIRKLNHDHKYVLQYIFESIEGKDYERGSTYIQKQLGMYRTKNEVWTGFPCIDFLIENGRELAKKDNVKFCFDVDITSLPIEEYDLFVILGNLLDNAFEASTQCKMGTGYVNIKLKNAGNILFIYLENNYFIEPQKLKNRFISTKGKEGHGYGLENVKEIIKKNGGTINLDYGNFVFAVEIMFGGKV